MMCRRRPGEKYQTRLAAKPAKADRVARDIYSVVERSIPVVTPLS
ncbi:MAG TPA: hypothetical protein VGO73_01835 [Pyrinomonadaceae bacterium]|jgi:hypothetical protein|nr:hypothetical protein [Pyrinomonadaceae bacterium]